MARRAEGWKLSVERGWYYIRFRHAGRRFKVALSTEDAGEATRRAPEAYAEAIQGKRGRVILSATAPLEEACAAWLASLEGPGGLDPKTVRSYLYYARAWCDRWQRLGELTATDLKAWARERLGQVARVTVRKEVGALRGLLAWAKEEGLVPAIPVIDLPKRAPGTRQRRRRPVPLSPEQVQQLLAHVPETSQRPTRSGRLFPVRAYLEFLFETGLRPVTVAALEVPRSWAPGQATLQIDDEEDKSIWGRAVPLSRRALELLAEHAPASGPIWGTYRALEAIKRAAVAVGLPREVAVYDLRHARLTALADAGASRAGLQLLAGHRSADTTNRYLHPLEGAARAALAAVEGVPTCRARVARARGFGSPIGSQSPSEGPRCGGPAPGICPVISGTCAQGGT